MSAAEVRSSGDTSGGAAPRSTSRESAGVELRGCALDIVEIAALRAGARRLEGVAAGRGVILPPLGRITAAKDRLVLAVRPDRWLMLTEPATAGEAAAPWREACSGFGIAIDHSSGLAALHLAGPPAREVLARGCRLDLHASAFATGHAAATVIAQVGVTLAALPSGWLLLTPSTTARHFQEWLASAARPFGLTLRSERSGSLLFEEIS